MNRETSKKGEKRHKGYKGGHCNDVTDHESRTRNLLRTAEQISGDHRAVAPPVPIPNTAVKRCSPDGSATKGRARVGRRQNPATWKQVAGLFFGCVRASLLLGSARVSRAMPVRLGLTASRRDELFYPSNSLS